MKYVIIPTGTNTAETRAVSPHSCSFFLFTTKRFLVLILVFPANSGTITFKHGNCSSAETNSIAERKKTEFRKAPATCATEALRIYTARAFSC